MQSNADEQPRMKVKVKSGHRITVPKKFRQKHGISEGDSVYIAPSDYASRDEVSEEELEEIRELVKEAYGFTPEI